MPLAPPDPELVSDAILEELTSSRSLMDGVIPDLPVIAPSVTARFAFGSCQYPGGFVDGAVAYDAYADLWRRLSEDVNHPRFVVLTGDQIYVDEATCTAVVGRRAFGPGDLRGVIDTDRIGECASCGST